MLSILQAILEEPSRQTRGGLDAAGICQDNAPIWQSLRPPRSIITCSMVAHPMRCYPPSGALLYLEDVPGFDAHSQLSSQHQPSEPLQSPSLICSRCPEHHRRPMSIAAIHPLLPCRVIVPSFVDNTESESVPPVTRWRRPTPDSRPLIHAAMLCSRQNGR